MTNWIRVAIGQFNELSHERLTFAQQIGASAFEPRSQLAQHPIRARLIRARDE